MSMQATSEQQVEYLKGRVLMLNDEIDRLKQDLGRVVGERARLQRELFESRRREMPRSWK